MGFNGLNRCFDFGLIGPISSGPFGPFRPRQTLSLEPKLAFWACLGLWGEWGALHREGLGGPLVTQNLVDEGGYVA